MEIFVSEATEAPAPRRPAPAYPILAESWGILGWYVLATLVVGSGGYALLNTATSWPRAQSILVASMVANGALLAFLRWKAGPRWQSWQLRGQARPWLFAALPAVAMASILVRSLLGFLHLPSTSGSIFQEISRTPAVALLLGAGGAAVLEEILFRGVILNGLLQNRRPWVAIAQSALLFSLFHLNPAQSVSAGLFGLLLGWLYYRTRSLGVCMAVHALNNSVAFVALRWAPAAWQKDPLLEDFGSGWAYAGAVGLSALVLAAVLWWVQRTTSPPVWAPGEPADDSAVAVGLGAAA
ncbi:CPBP family intramembrane glutamic endopeptidase [Hymenobacter nivis]|uniref:CAAX prenyl protease 2/Lysostaphin resistance protein A-like domain-containing protein n=1 Tax=Hymenobacter nivis TaxID=1850093 RepID=A0A2Z3GH47_9BACT|nr:type II CAAX endopeptidase family protein [Hymenobacter nivis]AWM31501.1 hypothetical protein DDQ68_01075 [Hymenobacter nivis]